MDGPQRQAAWLIPKSSTDHALHGPGRPHRALPGEEEEGGHHGCLGKEAHCLVNPAKRTQTGPRPEEPALTLLARRRTACPPLQQLES